jgi:hypothetical protein
MQFAIVQNGIVVNIAEAEHALDASWIPFASGCIIGGTWNGSVFGPDPNASAKAQEILALQAKALLEQSDRVVLRCYSAGVPVPTIWQSYRMNLRAVVNGTQSTLPTMPAYPIGT